MIVEYEKERDMIFISKSVDGKWVQLGFTQDEVRKIFDASHSSQPVPDGEKCCITCINVPCKILDRVPCPRQENPCEDNGCTDIENCDEICQHSRIYSPVQMQAARKAERERVLDTVVAWKRKHGYWFTINAISGEERYHFEPDRFEEFIESLRGGEP